MSAYFYIQFILAIETFLTFNSYVPFLITLVFITESEIFPIRRCLNYCRHKKLIILVIRLYDMRDMFNLWSNTIYHLLRTNDLVGYMRGIFHPVVILKGTSLLFQLHCLHRKLHLR